MSRILELFSTKKIIDYLKDRQYPAMLGEELFPERKEDDLDFEILKEGSKLPVVASVHAFDTESEIGSREAEEMAIEACLIKRKIPLREKEIIKLENPRTDKEEKYLIQKVYSRDIDALVEGIRARVEVMRMEVLSKGTVTLDENGLKAVINYGVPEEHQATQVDWTTSTENPIQDIIDWVNVMDEKPARALTSTTVLGKLLRHPSTISALYGKDTTRIPTVAELNTYLEALGLPKIYTYDKKYRKQGANGKYTVHRYLPEDAFVMFPDYPLGETLYGPTAEEIRLINDPTTKIEEVGNILAMVYEEGKDPVATWEKAVATAVPTFPYADEVFQAEIKLT